MRNTLTIEEDVAAKLKERCRRTGRSFKEVVNKALREGLNTEKAQRPREPFRVESRPLDLLPGVQLDNIGELLEQLDGPGHR